VLSKIIHGLWDYFSKVLSDCGRGLLDHLEEAGSIHPILDDVDKLCASNLELIEQIEVVDNETT